MVRLRRASAVVVISLLTSAVTASAQQDEVSSISCVISGKASSTFWFPRPGFTPESWSGEDPYIDHPNKKAYPHFDVSVPVDRGWFIEFLFSKLDQANPIVQPVFADGAGVEVKANVLERSPNVVVLMFRWASHWHSAVINFKVRKAVIADVESTSAGVGGSVRTADCK